MMVKRSEDLLVQEDSTDYLEKHLAPDHIHPATLKMELPR